ncbi:hypothetical protein QVD17_24581 [Tagetes erecta]|uniref:Uncharacterized protein n=1 Tax=Tagetes erecta TaxID=13708 RepID=A0AAD8NUU4_TARER|nr:hypothetical protein QVD17_24581 [Tagetes erecta]
MSAQCTHSGPCYGWIDDEEDVVPAPPSYTELEPTEDESDQQQDSQSANGKSASLLEADDDVQVHLSAPRADPIPAPLAPPAQPPPVEEVTDPYFHHVPYHEHARLRHRLAALADYAGRMRLELNHLVETVGDCRDEFLNLKEYTGGAEDHAIMLADDLWDTQADVRTI